MIVQTPAGPAQFPDSMSTDDIQAVLRKQFPPTQAGGTTPAPSAAPAAQASQPPAAQDIGTMPIWQKPADVSWMDFELAHLARAFPTKAGSATGELAALGSGLTAGATNLIPGATEAMKTLDPQERMILEGGGYLFGPGKLGIASKIGTPISGLLGGGKLAQYTGGALGAAGEGALVSGLPVATSGGSAQDVERAAGLGALAGGIGGSLGGVVGRGGTLPAGPSQADLEQEATRLYAPTERIGFSGPNDITPLTDQVTSSMTQAEKDAAKQAIAIGTRHDAQGIVSASDIQETQRDLKKIMGRGDPSNVRFASAYHDQLQNVLESVQPSYERLNPGQGPPQWVQASSFGGPTTAAAGDAARAIKAGNVPWGQAQELARVQTFQDIENAGGPTVAQQVEKWLPSEEGRQFAPAGSTAYPAYKNVSALAGSRESIPWWAKHAFLYPAAHIAGGELVGALSGDQHPEPWWERLGADVAAGGLLYGGMRGYGAMTGRLNAARQQAAVDALRSTIANRQYTPPAQLPAPLRDALRTLIFGGLSSGAARGTGVGY